MRRNAQATKLTYFWQTCRRKYSLLFWDLGEDIKRTGALESYDFYLNYIAQHLQQPVEDLNPKISKLIHDEMRVIRRINTLQAEENSIVDFLWRLNPAAPLEMFTDEPSGRESKSIWCYLPERLALTARDWAVGDAEPQSWIHNLPWHIEQFFKDKAPQLPSPYKLGRPHHLDNTSWRLYVDDLRPCPIGWVYAQNLKDFQALFPTRGAFGTLPQEISFDHDLGEEEPTGYDLLMFLMDMCLEANLELPTIHIHSANPVGAGRMRAALENWPRMQTIYNQKETKHVP